MSSSGYGIPTSVNWVATFYTNESLYALDECCPSPYVHRIGLESCVVWCELTDDYLDQLKSKESIDTKISTCMDQASAGRETHTVRYKTSSAAMHGVYPPGVKGLFLASLVILALCQ